MATVFIIQDLLETDMDMIRLSASFRHQQFISSSGLFGQQGIKLICHSPGKAGIKTYGGAGKEMRSCYNADRRAA